jgi:hypothetical protein
MVGLGILRLVEEDRFSLRSPNVALLMGTLDEVQTALLGFVDSEPPLEYEPGTFRAADVADHCERSPLTAQQESGLRTRRSGVSVVYGVEAAGLAKTARFLKLSMGSDRVETVSSVPDRQTFVARVQEQLSRLRRDGSTLLLVPTYVPWDWSWAKEIADVLRHGSAQAASLRVVFLVDAANAWRLLQSGHGTAEDWQSAGVEITSLASWHDSTLRAWIDDCGFGPRDPSGRQIIATETGNWPGVIEAYAAAIAGEHSWNESLTRLSALIDGDDHDKWVQEFGLGLAEPRRVLGELASVPGASTSELIELLSGTVPAAAVQRSLEWASLLNLAHPGPAGSWRLDAFVARLLRAQQPSRV